MPPSPDRSPGSLLALGDSITAAEGSWARRLAAALGLAPLILARDGARAAGAVAEQLPRAAGRHALAAVYLGVNDARAPDWDAPAFARDVERVLATVAVTAPVTLALTVPRDLGRPPAGVDAVAAGALVRAAAAACGALVVELGDFGSWRHVWPDHVHPTAAGQALIAARAATVLRAAGWEVGPLAPDRAGPAARARHAAHYVRALGADLARRRREAAAARS